MPKDSGAKKNTTHSKGENHTVVRWKLWKLQVSQLWLSQSSKSQKQRASTIRGASEAPGCLPWLLQHLSAVKSKNSRGEKVSTIFNKKWENKRVLCNQKPIFISRKILNQYKEQMEFYDWTWKRKTEQVIHSPCSVLEPLKMAIMFTRLYLLHTNFHNNILKI